MSQPCAPSGRPGPPTATCAHAAGPLPHHVSGMTMRKMDMAALTRLVKSMVPLAVLYTAKPKPKMMGAQIMSCVVVGLACWVAKMSGASSAQAVCVCYFLVHKHTHTHPHTHPHTVTRRSVKMVGIGK